MAFGESRIQILDFTIYVESDTRTVPMEIEPPVQIQQPNVPDVTQKKRSNPDNNNDANKRRRIN